MSSCVEVRAPVRPKRLRHLSGEMSICLLSAV